MNFSHYFIKRPIFAGVLSIAIFMMGLLALFKLPIAEYPEVVPPTIVVKATYPGATPKTIAETVASPLEQSINGVEGALYTFSQATGDGVMTLTVTFALGTDIDNAQVQVQNRVSQALPKLPEEVRALGVTTTKQSPDLTMVVHLFSPDGRYDNVYLRNYAALQVKDVLARIPGAGDVELFGSGDYAMRVWLNPDKIASRNLTASDVVDAIREQNIQVAGGVIGQQPVGKPVDFEMQVNVKGRLISEEEFGNIVVKTGSNGEKILLKDLARIELGASTYSLHSLLDNKTAVAIPIFQSPGANALQLSSDVRRTMAELKKNFPEGIDYSVVYDPTVFVRRSIEAVIHTLLEAILLVVIVVIVFLQTWRAAIIPLAAVPVSLVGTFSMMLAFGFSINALSLFGLVLAIGIVVDDAIVVVENVERNIARGLTSVEAAKQAMREVTGPIIATALVLCAVFIPTAFISGLTGQFYKQFALTIAISTVISAFNSLTLSPALSAVLLKDHHAPKDWLMRAMENTLGWFFRPFNHVFAWAGNKYSLGVGQVLRKGAIALILYAGLVFLTGWSFNKVPTGFVPTQDKQYLVSFAQLPEGASLDRTEAVIRRMSDIGLKQPGVESAVAFPGLSISGFTVAPNQGIVFFALKPFEERTSPALSGPAITAALNQKLSVIKEAFVLTVPPPAVMGLGQIGGFKLYVEDRADLGYDALYQNTQSVIGKSYQTAPSLAGVFSMFTVNVPQLDADIDRVQAKTQGVPLQNLFETLQIYLGSLYVNDFNRFGRTFEVIAQADAPFRATAEDITRLKTRNDKGEMVPLGAIVKVTETHGPDRVMRYNGYPAAEINGAPAPGYSSGQAEAAMAKLLDEGLPRGMSYEWTELTYQRILAGNTAVYVGPLCILLVFLVLAALYESFRLPLAIILIVPMCLLFAITGVWLKGSDNNIFTQIGFIVLVGLACKNAILIVEFAKRKQDEGLSPFEAAIEACRLRLRPILMTSIAFIAGVFPLVVAKGAGAEMRQAMGIAVFSGMIGVTLFGLFLTPVFYVTLMKLGWKKKPAATERGAAPGTTGMVAGAASLVLLFTVMSAQAGLVTVGPDYKSPTNVVPSEYKAEQFGNWKTGQPLDNVPKGNWWTIFNDTNLDELEAKALQANQELKAAVARVDESRATARVARADLLPNLSLDPSFTRQRYSPAANPSFGAGMTANTWSTPLDLSYEIDLWGRVRRGFESARADAQASLADYYNVLLTLQSDVAQNYFSLRSLDAEIATVNGTVGLRKEQVQLVRSRYEGGVGNELEVAQAQTEQATTEAELASLAHQRDELENAIAILVGENPVSFRLPALDEADKMWNPMPPEIPAGLPGDLLERRPDVATAERQLASANAKIGVAKGAFFPVVSLTASGGYLSGDAEDLFNWSSRVWSIGPSVSLPIFAGGRNLANLRRARSAYDESVALYRQQVLVAFGDVENSLSGIRHLAVQSEAQTRAVTNARRATDLATERYRSGLVAYIEVVDSSRDMLDAERANAQLAGQRLITAVQLIKALGGGWDEREVAVRADKKSSL